MKDIGGFKGPLKVIRAESYKDLEERVNFFIAEQKKQHGEIWCDIDFKVDNGALYAFIMTTPIPKEEGHIGCSCNH